MNIGFLSEAFLRWILADGKYYITVYFEVSSRLCSCDLFVVSAIDKGEESKKCHLSLEEIYHSLVFYIISIY